MTATVELYLEGVNDLIDGGFDKVRLYRYTDPNLMSIALATLVTTITLVEDQEVYSYEDASGDASSWYAYTVYSTLTTDESTLSLKWRASDTTLTTLMIEAARRANNGFTGVATGGSLTTIADTVLTDFGVDEHYGSGWWIWLPNAAAAADRVPRRVSEEGYSGGTWTVGRAWSVAPVAGDVYYVFGLLPPVELAGSPWSWQRAVNEGLQHCRFVDTLNVGDGDGRKVAFSLRQHLGYINPEQDIRAVSARRTLDADAGIYSWVDYTKNGRFWTRQRDDGDYAVVLWPPPPAELTVMVEVRRRGAELYSLTDATNCPQQQVVKAAVWQMYEWLVANGRGEFATQAASAKTAFEAQRRIDGGVGVLIA